LIFEQCGHDPLHIYVKDEVVKPSWQQDFHAAHEHNDAVTSVGITCRRSQQQTAQRLDQRAVAHQGRRYLPHERCAQREGCAKRLVFPGVHMLFDARFDREWGADPRTNTLVFIGKISIGRR